jgi:hypothetical protein
LPTFGVLIYGAGSPVHLFHRASQVAELLWRDAKVSVTPRQLAFLVTIAKGEGLLQPM